MHIKVRCIKYSETNNKITAVTTNTRLWRVFFCVFKPEFSWTSINCFHGFPRALTEKVPSSQNEGRIISNDDGFLNYFIKMKDYIVKTTRSLRAEWNSRNILYSLRNGFQVVYAFDYMKTREPWTHCQEASINSKKQKTSHWKGKKFPLNGGCFRKWILLLISFFMLSNRNQN